MLLIKIILRVCQLFQICLKNTEVGKFNSCQWHNICRRKYNQDRFFRFSGQIFLRPALYFGFFIDNGN